MGRSGTQFVAMVTELNTEINTILKKAFLNRCVLKIALESINVRDRADFMRQRRIAATNILGEPASNKYAKEFETLKRFEISLGTKLTFYSFHNICKLGENARHCSPHL